VKQEYTGPYTFDVAARTITLAGIEVPQERLALVVNSTVGFIYHNIEHEPTAQVSIVPSTVGGILSAVGYDAIDSFNGDYALFQGGLDKGGVVNIVGGVITVVNPGNGYSAGFANSVGGTRFVIDIDPSFNTVIVFPPYKDCDTHQNTDALSIFYDDGVDLGQLIKDESDETQALLQAEFDEMQTLVSAFKEEFKDEIDHTQSVLETRLESIDITLADFQAEALAESNATQNFLSDTLRPVLDDFKTEAKSEADATQTLLNLKLSGLINGFLGIEHLVKYSAENGYDIDFTSGGYGPSQIVFSKGNTVLKTIRLIYDGRGDLVLITPEWSPLLLSPSLWLESSVVVSDGAVSQWSDSSGNGLNLSQPNVSQRPLYNTTINGLPAVNFSGDSMNLEGVNFTKGPGVYIIFAGQHNAAASAEGAVSHYFDSVTSTQRVSVRYFPGGTIQALTRGLDEGDGDDVESIRVYNYNFQARPFILSFASGVSAFIKVDGGAASSFGALGGESFTGLNLGNWLNDSLVMNGAIGEFIVLDQAPSLTEQSQLEGYLAHKWGAAGYLPANHPYKTSPP